MQMIIFFFLKDSQSNTQLFELFSTFFIFWRLKPNLRKCEIAGVGALKGVRLAVWGMKCIDQRKFINILGTYVSYNNGIKGESNFLKVGSNVQTVIKLWRFWNLTFEGRIAVFKSLATLKIVFRALIATMPSYIFKTLETIQTHFLCNNTNPKINHKTNIKSFREGGLKKCW